MPPLCTKLYALPVDNICMIYAIGFSCSISVCIDNRIDIIGINVVLYILYEKLSITYRPKENNIDTRQLPMGADQCPLGGVY